MHEFVHSADTVWLVLDDSALSDDVALTSEGGALTSSQLAGSILGHDASIPAGSHALSR